MDLTEILPKGTVLANRYQIYELLGEGATGVVYLAMDQQLDSFRAIKQMTVEYITPKQYAKAISDFQREAELLSKIKHPSIPAFYNYFVQEGNYYLVMEYIIGKNLLEILEETPKFVSEKQVTRWAIQLCDVLNYIHSYNPPIIYRDMKPANIIYDKKLRRLYLVDFGTARFVAALRASGLTAIGTLGYAPPELFEGSVGPETDIYSLAATLIHLLVGSFPPFHPYYGFNFEENPHPHELNPKVSKNISEILVRAVSIQPEDRYSSAKEMQKELKEHLANLW